MENKVTITRPFGPKIGVVKLPKEIVTKLINITDRLITDKKRENYGCALVGQIKEEVRISNELLEKENLYNIFQQYLGDYIAYCLKESCIHYNNKHTLEVAVTDMWFNEMKAGEYNPAHFHTKCYVSSVLYLKIPKNRPKRNIECKEDKDGTINFIDRSVSPDLLQSGMLSIQPQEGEMYIWPSSLLHCVYPFLGDEVRRSIAWNGVYRLVDDEKGVILLGGTPHPEN